MDEFKDNGTLLRELINSAGMQQLDALALFNRGQARELSVSQWKAYLANPDSSRRSPCPDRVLERARKVIKRKD